MSDRPLLLDLFCGIGGAALGYADAGFDVVGVDLRAQPRYPFEFVQGDALEVGARLLAERPIAAVHASPPCQGYSSHVSSRSSEHAGTRGKDEPQLIEPVRNLLAATGRPYVIENVVGARHALRGPILLCGVMLGLPIPRHRLFELGQWRLGAFDVPRHPRCAGVAKAYADERGWDWRDTNVTGKGRHAGTTAKWVEVMGWPTTHAPTQHGLREAIPPAYTRWLGTQLLTVLAAVRSGVDNLVDTPAMHS